MGKITGFMEFERKPAKARPVEVRLNDFYEVYGPQDEETLRKQGSRCMDCGIPFCQSDYGCPVDNLIPEWNDLVYHGRWREAYENLLSTNNFPEWTGRICPAPCESACVLGINEPAVAIKSIEAAIIDHAWEEGWVVPRPPESRTGKKVAVVGSGPGGLAAADQLNKAGHTVTVYERDDRLGGLLMYGVPNMKLDKENVTRRIDLMRQEGVIFKTGVNVGVDIDAQKLREQSDAILLACGALQGRDLPIPGRDLGGVHMAMDYLTVSTRWLLDAGVPEGEALHEKLAENSPDICAKDKNVIVIGGGDTGTDCIGTALRQGCKSLINITRRVREPSKRDREHPWPGPLGTFLIDYGHAEGAAKFGRDPRKHEILPKEFVAGEQGELIGLKIVEMEWSRDAEGKKISREKPGSEQILPADMVLLSIGFIGHDAPGVVEALGVQTKRGCVVADSLSYATNAPGIYVAGDMRRGASLIVWAIAEGRKAAKQIDQYIMADENVALHKIETSGSIAA